MLEAAFVPSLGPPEVPWTGDCSSSLTEACVIQRAAGPLILRPISGRPSTAADREHRWHPTAHQPSLAAPRRDHQSPRRRRSPGDWPRSPPATPTSKPPSTTTGREATANDTAFNSSPPTSPTSDVLPSRLDSEPRMMHGTSAELMTIASSEMCQRFRGPARGLGLARYSGSMPGSARAEARRCSIQSH